MTIEPRVIHILIIKLWFMNLLYNGQIYIFYDHYLTEYYILQRSQKRDLSYNKNFRIRIPAYFPRVFLRSSPRVFFGSAGWCSHSFRVHLRSCVTLYNCFPTANDGPNVLHDPIDYKGLWSQQERRRRKFRRWNEKLETLSINELRQEALRYYLPVSTGRNRLIDMIMSHFEQNSLIEEMLPLVQHPRAASGRLRVGSCQAEQLVQEMAAVIPPAEIPMLQESMERIVEILNLCFKQQRHIICRWIEISPSSWFLLWVNQPKIGTVLNQCVLWRLVHHLQRKQCRC